MFRYLGFFDIKGYEGSEVHCVSLKQPVTLINVVELFLQFLHPKLNFILLIDHLLLQLLLFSTLQTVNSLIENKLLMLLLLVVSCYLLLDVMGEVHVHLLVPWIHLGCWHDWLKPTEKLLLYLLLMLLLLIKEMINRISVG